jgi:hypothetical protein
MITGNYQAFGPLLACTQAVVYDEIPIYIEVFWVMIPCSLVDGYKYRTGRYCLQKSGCLQLVQYCLWRVLASVTSDTLYRVLQFIVGRDIVAFLCSFTCFDIYHGMVMG